MLSYCTVSIIYNSRNFICFYTHTLAKLVIINDLTKYP